MPQQLPLFEALPKLPEILSGMEPGEEIVLTVEGEPTAIVTKPARKSWPSKPGTAKDRHFWMAPDFDAPMDEFGETAK